jgi:Peroxidase
MHPSTSLFFLAALAAAQQGGNQQDSGTSFSCPAIWTQISKDLTSAFLTNGQCNDLARAAIRTAFHDCATWDTSLGTSAGCDGSIYLAGEYTRSENAGLESTVPQLGQMAQKYAGITVADFLQFAGAHAIKTCPGGPTVQIFVGREDRSSPNPDGLLPPATISGQDNLELWAAKGFSAREVAALVGAHSTAKQFVTDTSKAGAGLDDTPGIWDVVSLAYSSSFNRPEVERETWLTRLRYQTEVLWRDSGRHGTVYVAGGQESVPAAGSCRSVPCFCE